MSSTDTPSHASADVSALFARARAGDVAARNELVVRNQGLVKTIAKKFYSTGLDFDDLVQEGSIGLQDAVSRYEPERGFRFATFASRYIWGFMIRAMREKGSLVRVPSNRHDAVGSWKRARAALEQEHGREPTDAELEAATGIRADDVRLSTRRCSRLESPVRKGEDDTLGSTLAAPTQPPDEDTAELEAALADHELARRLLAELPRRTRLVIARRFGIGGEARTLRQIGARIGVTGERVRLIEKDGLEKLKRSAGRELRRRESEALALEAIARGESVYQAALAAGMRPHALYGLIGRDPAFAGKVDELRLAPPGEGSRTRSRDDLALDALTRGLSVKAAACEAGIGIQTLWRRLRSDPRFAEVAARIRAKRLGARCQSAEERRERTRFLNARGRARRRREGKKVA